MNTPLRIRRFLLVLSTSLLAESFAVHAQTAGEAVITKVDGALITAPSVSYSGAPSKSSSTKKWMEIETTFNWQPAQPKSQADLFTDDLTVNYYVLLKNPSPQYPQGALLTGQTLLSSVPAKSLDPKNSELRTVVYVSPRTLERMFAGKAPTDISSAVTDIGVTISKQGEVIAQKSFKSAQGGWWPQLQQVNGFVLNKPDSPFASLNWDYYEQVKKQP
jgi:hypothetical protein